MLLPSWSDSPLLSDRPAEVQVRMARVLSLLSDSPLWSGSVLSGAVLSGGNGNAAALFEGQAARGGAGWSGDGAVLAD